MTQYRWESLGLFSVPLIKLKLDRSEEVRELFFSRVQNLSQAQTNTASNTDNLTHYHNDSNVFSTYPELSWLKRWIEESAGFVYHDLLNYKRSGAMKLVSAWFNLAQAGASQTKHAHANSLLSGTLYLNTDKETSITFYHPLTTGSLHNELFDQAVQKHNEHGLQYHFTQVEISVKQGECLFWPSRLAHGYSNNRTNNRLSFSFNLMPERLNSVYQILN
ncbi:TIGR02466 family protein [Agarilytica rhodophyticola]|uniref:TIGR02466 family protein n=1 Tax=Agarilytica rhodophyticola TaxID=1737490 RepID=UPI000B34639E|nr:TIGR02466 family protein [Agarilytica rhodophyticola]